MAGVLANTVSFFLPPFCLFSSKLMKGRAVDDVQSSRRRDWQRARARGGESASWFVMLVGWLCVCVCVCARACVSEACGTNDPARRGRVVGGREGPSPPRPTQARSCLLGKQRITVQDG